MKSSGSLAAFNRSNAFLHSAAPFALHTVAAISSLDSFKLSSTAAVTPPEFAKRLPNDDQTASTFGKRFANLIHNLHFPRSSDLPLQTSWQHKVR